MAPRFVAGRIDKSARLVPLPGELIETAASALDSLVVVSSSALLRETYRPLGTWVCPGGGTAHSTIRWRRSIFVGRMFQAPRPNHIDRTPRLSPRGYGRKVGVISAPYHSFSGQLLLRTEQQLTSLPDGFVVRASLARIRAKDHPRPAWVAMRCLVRDSVRWIGSSQLPLCLKALPLGLTVRLELSSAPPKADGMTTLLR